MAASPSCKLYVDPLSQPSRALMLFCRVNALKVEEVTVKLRALEQQSDAYKGVNPLAKVPALQEPDGFVLPESCAILRYLCNSRSTADHWYPVRPRGRARVDAALDWHHSTLRRGAATLVFLRFFRNVTAPAETDRALKQALFFLKPALAQLDTFWLGDKPFIGGHSLSIADLVLACEVSQLELLDAGTVPPSMRDLLAPHARVRLWLEAVRGATQPHWDEVHGALKAAAAARAKL